MTFGGWLPLHDAPTVAPDAPGVLQGRADGVRPYPRGKSAMVWYARCRPDETLRGYVRGRGAAGLARAAALGAVLVRFGGSAAPEPEFQRLLGRFVERFGAPPSANPLPDEETPPSDA